MDNGGSDFDLCTFYLKYELTERSLDFYRENGLGADNLIVTYYYYVWLMSILSPLTPSHRVCLMVND